MAWSHNLWILLWYSMIAFTIRAKAHTHVNLSDFPSPAGFDRKGWCGTCNGTGAATCENLDCTQRCAAEGHQCFKPGCCCDPRMVPRPPDYTCKIFRSANKPCAWHCCSASFHEGRPVAARLCGDNGCCSPTPHGMPRKCGASLFLAQVGGKYKRLPCCLEEAASQERQTGIRCCFHGAGINCNTNASCCIEDPHAVCQSSPTKKHPAVDNCQQFVPCPGKTGTDCSSANKRVCCLQTDAPSEHDPCQLSSQDCGLGGRYDPCPSSSSLGVDCSAATPRSICCMPEGRETSVCRRTDCKAYTAENARNRTALMLASLLFVGVLAWVLRRCCRRKRRDDNSRSTSLLLSDGSVALALPRLEHEKRIALVITCQSYAFYPELKTPHNDGEAMADKFRDLGYTVIHVHGETVTRMVLALQQAIQGLAGTTGALLVMYYAGHAVEMQGALMWAAEDACSGDMSGHLNMVDVCSKVQDLHLKGDALQWFGCASEVRRLYVVVLADCCRTPSVEETLGCFVSHCEVSRTQRRARDRAFMCFIYCCDPSCPARDGEDHSPFAQELLKQLPVPQNVVTFSEHVAIGLAAATSGRQRLWRREVCGADFQRVSLADVPEYLRSSPTSVVSS